MDINKFNERFKLRVTDVVGDFSEESITTTLTVGGKFSFSFLLAIQKANDRLK